MKDKHMVIYSNYYNEEMWNDIKESLIEQNEEFGGEKQVDDCKVWEYYYEDLDMYFEDLKEEVLYMGIGKVLMIADLGLWNGRKRGYKIINSSNMFYSESDYIEIYADGKDIKSKNSHHDGTNYITYREIKEGVDISKLTDKIYAGEEITAHMLGYYTNSLYPKFKKHYSWKG